MRGRAADAGATAMHGAPPMRCAARRRCAAGRAGVWGLPAVRAGAGVQWAAWRVGLAFQMRSMMRAPRAENGTMLSTQILAFAG